MHFKKYFEIKKFAIFISGLEALLSQRGTFIFSMSPFFDRTCKNMSSIRLRSSNFIIFSISKIRTRHIGAKSKCLIFGIISILRPLCSKKSSVHSGFWKTNISWFPIPLWFLENKHQLISNSTMVFGKHASADYRVKKKH